MILKFLRYFTLILAIANTANAQTITNEELQSRFNKAFSVFNKNAETSNEKTNSNSQQSISLEQDSDKNIVKQTTNEVTSQTLPVEVKKLTLPSMPNDTNVNAKNFIMLEEREVLIDMQNTTLNEIVQEALNQVSAGEKWTIRWRLKDENKYLLRERINLTAEVSFDSFMGNMLETITNITGIRLSTKVFNKNRIIIITDSF
jgi:hypothetical protein